MAYKFKDNVQIFIVMTLHLYRIFKKYQIDSFSTYSEYLSI